jgi:hypothetical protein
MLSPHAAACRASCGRPLCQRGDRATGLARQADHDDRALFARWRCRHGRAARGRGLVARTEATCHVENKAGAGGAVGIGLAARAGFRMTPIPYTAAGPAVLALLAGQVEAAASGPLRPWFSRSRPASSARSRTGATER